MPALCPQCSGEVSAGAAFCPHCKAPLIKVNKAQEGPAAPLNTPSPSGGAGIAQAPLQPGPPEAHADGINWPMARSRALLAAIILTALTFTPVTSAFFFLWAPLCGALAVFLYHRQEPQTGISTGAGARMGLTAGVLGFVMIAALLAVAFAIYHFAMHQSVLAQFRSQLEAAIKANPDPAARQAASQFLTDNGLKLLMVIGGAIMFVLFLLLSAAGGAVQALILRHPKQL